MQRALRLRHTRDSDRPEDGRHQEQNPEPKRSGLALLLCGYTDCAANGHAYGTERRRDHDDATDHVSIFRSF